MNINTLGSSVLNGKDSLLNSRSQINTESLVRRANKAENRELREVCEEFESIFVKMMLDSMRKTLSDNTLIPKNAGEKLFEDQLYDEYSKKISREANLGIAEMMYNQLSSKVNASDSKVSGGAVSDAYSSLAAASYAGGKRQISLNG